MKKAIKKTGKILTGILAGLLFLLLLAGGSLNLPWVQNRIARLITDKLSEFMDCRVTVSAADITLSKRTVKLYDFTIYDRHDSVSVYAREGMAVIRAANAKTTALSSALLVDPCIFITRYEGEEKSDFLRVIQKIAARARLKDTSERKAFEMDLFRIENATFTYNNEYKAPKNNGCIDFRHIHLFEGHARGRNFYAKLGVVKADVDFLQAKEKSGVTVEEFFSGIYVNKGELRFNEAYLRTPQSEARLSIGLVTEEHDWRQFRDFIHKVNFEADIKPESRVSARDLRLFAPVFGKMRAKVKLEGAVSGPIADLDLHAFKAAYGAASDLDADIRLTGVPDTLILDLNLRALHLSRSDVERVVLPAGGSIRLPDLLEKWETASLTGRFSGSMEKFSSQFFLQSNLGDIGLSNTVVDSLEGPAVMTGEVSARGIRLDKLLKTDTVLRQTDADIEFFLSGRDWDKLVCQLEGKVENLSYAGGLLQPVALNIYYQKKFYRGAVECRDPRMDFRLFGSVDLRSNTSVSDFSLVLRRADLSPLHLLGDSGIFTVATRMKVRSEGNRLDSLQGRLELNDTRLHRLGRECVLDRLVFDLGTASDASRKAEITSGLLQVGIQGDWAFRGFGALASALAHRHLSKTVDSTASVPFMDFTATVDLSSKADSLLSLFLPSLRLPFGLSARLNSNPKNSLIQFRADLPYVQFKKVAGMRAGLRADITASAIGMEMHAGRIFLDEQVRLTDFVAILDGGGANPFSYGFYWNSDSVEDVVHSQKSGIEGDLHLMPDRAVMARIQDCRVTFAHAWWKALPDGYIYYSPDSIVFNQIGLKSETLKSGVKLNGELSHRSSSLLRVDFKDFSLRHFNTFTQSKLKIELGGEINGYARVHDFYEAFSFDADFSVDSLYLNRRLYGRLAAGSRFSRKEAINLTARVVDHSGEILNVGGVWYPRQQGRLDFKGRLQRLPVDFLGGILAKTLQDMEGTLDGVLKIGGSISHPDLYLKGETDNLAATVAALQTRYAFTHFGLTLTSGGLTFNDCRFRDPIYHTEGTLKGGLTYHNFKSIGLDIGVDFKNLLVLNTKRSLDRPFWGTVFGSGALKITGPVNDINLHLAARVDDNSDISFDFANTSGGNGAKFVNFVSARPRSIDTVSVSYERFYARTREAVRQRNKLSMDLNLEVTPGLAVSLGLRNTAMEGKLSGTGSGLLRLQSVPGSTRLYGTYVIDGGEFDFSMAEIISKKFVLENGGVISWMGPISDARIDIRAGYQTKAALYPVLSSFEPTEDEARQYKQKAGVKSVIVLSGNLSSPNIGFDIELPNTDDDTRDKFFAMVKKDDEGEMLRQTFSLLMFNSFMPVGRDASGIGNAALASSADFVFSQFNNFLSQFTENVNIGMNYRMKDAVSNSEFQVNMSSQFFDDRLTINGSLGITDKNEAAINGTSAVVGDIDVEWKFTEEIRLKGFNHSNDQDLTKPVNSYTQGVGLVFKRDFDNWKEFIHGTRAKMTRRERIEDRERKREIRREKRKQKR